MEKQTKILLKIILSAPAIIITAGIFLVSNMSQANIEYPFSMMDKLLHAAAFFIYGLTLGAAFYSFFHYKSDKTLRTWVFIWGAVYAILDEVHQAFVPGRNADILDWASDIVGISLSIIFFNIIKRLVEKILDLKEN